MSRSTLDGRPRRQDLDGRRDGRLARRQDPRADPHAALRLRRLRGRPRLQHGQRHRHLPPAGAHRPPVQQRQDPAHADALLQGAGQRGAEAGGARQQAGELLPAPADLDRLAEAGRQPQGQHNPPDGRRLGLGRLPGRGGHEARHPRQDLQLHPPPRQHHDDAGQGGEQLQQLDPGQHGSAGRRLRRGAAAGQPRASSPKARARTSSSSRTAWSTRPTCRPAR